MNTQESLDQQSSAFDPSRDTLVALRPLTHNEGVIQAGEAIPVADFTAERLKQLIRVRHAGVVFGGAKNAPAAPVAGAIMCDQCGRTFAKKVNLGAHLRSHRG